jgi:hypothetical protein
MLTLSDLLSNKNNLAQDIPSSQMAFHGLYRDADGKLTYSKALFANTQESIELTDGTGFAYNGLEELIRGTTDSGVAHNTIPTYYNEVGDKVQQAKTIKVRVVNGKYNLELSGSTGSIDYNGVSNQSNTNIELELTYGATYTFDTSDSSTQGYPLYISTQPFGANYNYEWLLGVTNSRSAYGGKNGDLNTESPGPLTFTIPLDAPNVLYYASGNHSNVYGIINIRRETTNLKHRKYEQVRFDNIKLTYYINSRGFLVARYLNDYDYSGGPA